MKGLAESSPFYLLTNPHVINRFIFGHGVVIYYLTILLWNISCYKNPKNYQQNSAPVSRNNMSKLKNLEIASLDLK